MFDIIFINKGILFHDIRTAAGRVSAVNDPLLVLKADLGTGDERRKKNSMSLPAFPASYTLNAEYEHGAAGLHLSAVRAVQNEGAGLTAWTLHLGDGKRKYDIIIISLRKLETIRINLYHGQCIDIEIISMYREGQDRLW
jgi:hypothetical protein